jgi:hypothetical protein
MSAFTAKNYQIGARNTPHRIELLGDKTVKPESATHIIEFPGGAIELSRTVDDEYWAHIIVNRKWAWSELDGRESAIGQIVDSRIFRRDSGLAEIDDTDEVEQIAVLIRASRPRNGHGGPDAA